MNNTTAKDDELQSIEILFAAGHVQHKYALRLRTVINR